MQLEVRQPADSSTRRVLLRLWPVLLACLLTGGCASSLPPEGLDAEGRMHQHCAVCVKGGDLACVDVIVEDDTPKATYAGKEWYFCGKACRREFLEHPDKYVK